MNYAATSNRAGCGVGCGALKEQSSTFHNTKWLESCNFPSEPCLLHGIHNL